MGITANRGIYKILNLSTGLFYIGSAVHIKYRWKNHKIELKFNRHCNPYLQSAWNKYGEAAFEFSLIEAVEDRSILTAREQIWLDLTRCYEREIGYNLCRTAGSRLGQRPTAETLALLSARRKGKPRSEEDKRKISEGSKGRIFSAETRLKMSLARKGQTATAETKAKMSLASKGHARNKGRKQSAEEIAKRIASTTGKKRSPEAIARIVAGREKNKKPISDETRMKMRLAKLGKKHSDLAKNNMCGRSISLETRQKLSVAATNQWSLQKSVEANDGTLDYTSDMWV